MGAVFSAIFGGELWSSAGKGGPGLPGQELEFLKRIAGAFSDHAAAQVGTRQRDVMNYPVPDFLKESGYEKVVNVAITGNGGVGKSLFINTVRGIRPHEPNWAPVGVRETTTEPVWYGFPGESRVRLWDLEGACLSEVPYESTRDSIGIELELEPEWSTVQHYIRSIGLRYFDVVLVLNSSRHTETETELAHELRRFEVPFFYVRTKLDWDIENSEADYGLTPEETIRSIREELQESNVDDAYLINARSIDAYDFPRLLKDVLMQVSSRWPELMEGDGDADGGELKDGASDVVEHSVDGVLQLPRPGAECAEALYQYTGRWSWFKDEGYHEFLRSEMGEMVAHITSLVTASPEHTFRLMDDGRLQVKIQQGTSLNGGNFGCIDYAGDWSPEVEVDMLGMRLVGRGREHAIENRSLVMEFQGTVRSDQNHPVHFRFIREVIAGVYVFTYDNAVKGVRGSRYFKRWPWYRIENGTGERVLMENWNSWSMMYPAAKTEIQPGAKYVCASGRDTVSERLVFRLPDRTTHTVPAARPGSTYALARPDFSAGG